MSKASKRNEERKFKRLPVKFGPETPTHAANAIQLTGQGAFLLANRPIYEVGGRIVVQMKTPMGVHIVKAVVRHNRSTPAMLSRTNTNGMGIEFIDLSPELREYLDSL